MLNIPKHNCRGCGGCCGINPLSLEECDKILAYVKKDKENLIKVKEAINAKKDALACSFLDKNNKCSIYSARPIVCKIFGVDRHLICEYGNTANIDFRKLNIPELKSTRSMHLTNKLVKEIRGM